MFTQPLPSHPPLPQYYADPSQRQRFVREIFDETAAWYDGIVAMLSFGSESRYRRDALLRAGKCGRSYRTWRRVRKTSTAPPPRGGIIGLRDPTGEGVPSPPSSHPAASRLLPG